MGNKVEGAFVRACRLAIKQLIEDMDRHLWLIDEVYQPKFNWDGE